MGSVKRIVKFHKSKVTYMGGGFPSISEIEANEIFIQNQIQEEKKKRNTKRRLKI